MRHMMSRSMWTASVFPCPPVFSQILGRTLDTLTHLFHSVTISVAAFKPGEVISSSPVHQRLMVTTWLYFLVILLLIVAYLPCLLVPTAFFATLLKKRHGICDQFAHHASWGRLTQSRPSGYFPSRPEWSDVGQLSLPSCLSPSRIWSLSLSLRIENGLRERGLKGVSSLSPPIFISLRSRSLRHLLWS